MEVWFTGNATGRDLVDEPQADQGRERALHVSVAQDTGNSVLIIANEDYTGVNPTYPPRTRTEVPRRARRGAAANGVTPDVWDVDAQGVPHDLGVLGHYDAVLWYLGDNRLTQDPDDVIDRDVLRRLRGRLGRRAPAVPDALRRDYLNEGGKLALAGETAGTTASAGLPSVASTTASTGSRISRATSLSIRSRLPAAGRRLHPVLAGGLRRDRWVPTASPAPPSRSTASRRCSADRPRSTIRSTRPARSR